MVGLSLKKKKKLKWLSDSWYKDRDERHRCLRRADFKQLQGVGTFQNDVPSGLPSSVLLRDTLFPAFVYVSEAKRSEVKSLSRVRLFATPWTVAYQALPSMGFSRQEYWSEFAISFSRGSSRPRDRTPVSRIAGRRFNL